MAEEERFERGRAIQHPLYGDAIRGNLAGLPEDLRGVVPRLLTEFCFGDFYTRSGLDLALRELLVLCLLTALGGTEAQVQSHTAGNLQAGNNVDVQIAAMIHCIPYVGFPRALNAIPHHQPGRHTHLTTRGSACNCRTVRRAEALSSHT